ncbi:MAG TPA: F0F1 ATP synthase subunit B [Candidatus Saccharimonadales bacterium]|nr:F0F1 ATP synthase subunit B [Candidatus Saccharimonadales bacterium]
MYFAETGSNANPSLLSALGIDWKLLITQGLAFLILLWVLKKFVYPALIKSIDDRRNQIEAGLKEAKQSQEALEKAEAKVKELLEQARAEADGVVARSHKEGAAMVADAEAKAKQRAEQIVADARNQLAVDVSKARQELKAETIKLVAAATEHIIGEKLDERKDAGLIKAGLETGDVKTAKAPKAETHTAKGRK